MSRVYHKQEFVPSNPHKYTGSYPIVRRRRWEWDFMTHLDNIPTVLEWAREPFEVPYMDPLTGNPKVYVPDFWIKRLSRDGSVVQELVEIKPMHEQLVEHARSERDAAIQARNRAKWGAAIEWCGRHGVRFVVWNESNLYRGFENAKTPSNPVPQYAPGIRRPTRPARPRKPKKSLAEKTVVHGRPPIRRRRAPTVKMARIGRSRRA